MRFWKNSVPPNAFSEYVRDFWQRSVLFLDILRERGNQHPFIAMQSRKQWWTRSISIVTCETNWLSAAFTRSTARPWYRRLVECLPMIVRPAHGPGCRPFVLAAAEKEKLRLKGRIAEGDVFDAAARALVYIGKAQHRIDESTFDSLRKLLSGTPGSLRRLISRPLYASSGRSWPSTNALQLRRCRGCCPRMPRRVALSPTCSRKPLQRPASSMPTRNAD